MLPTKAKLWTVDDYHRMVETGVLTGSDRVELLEGQIIEVADSTLLGDRQQKALIYAKASIADYWILDVNAKQVYVFRKPTSADRPSIPKTSEGLKSRRSGSP